MTPKGKRWSSFSLRSLFVVMTLIAIVLGLWMRARRLGELAADHHFKALDFGYQAAAIQRPVDYEYEWKWPATIRMDPQTISEATPFWLDSMHHSELRDIYLAATRRPWMPVPALPSINAELPSREDSIPRWWNETIKPYVDENECLMDSGMGFPSATDRNFVLSEKLLSKKRFLELYARFRSHRGLEPIKDLR